MRAIASCEHGNWPNLNGNGTERRRVRGIPQVHRFILSSRTHVPDQGNPPDTMLRKKNSPAYRRMKILGDACTVPSKEAGQAITTLHLVRSSLQIRLVSKQQIIRLIRRIFHPREFRPNMDHHRDISSQSQLITGVTTLGRVHAWGSFLQKRFVTGTPHARIFHPKG